MRGSISIVLALTIMLLFSFPLVLIESVREETMLLQSYVAMDNATQSTLAEYQEVIWEKYDILAIDSNCDESKNPVIELEERLERYASYNIGGDIVNTLILRKDWLHLSMESVYVDHVVSLTDQQGYGAYRAMIEAQKRIDGITYFEELVTWKDVIEIQFDTSPLEDRKEEVSESFKSYLEELVSRKTEGEAEGEESASTQETEITVLENPLDVSNKWTLSMMLQYLLGNDYDECNFCELPLESIHIDDKSIQNTYQDYSVTDSIMFVQYLFEHMNYYEKENKSNLYEMEYILYGNESNYSNLEAAIEELVAFREIDNYLCIIQDSIRMSQIENTSAILTTLAQVPYMEPVLTQAILLAWAYVESISDVKILLEGGQVPLTKSITYITSSLDDVFGGLDLVPENKCLNGLTYKEYLMLFCFLKAPEGLTLRALDIMECNVRKEDNRESFQIEQCFLSYDAQIKFYDVFHKTYHVDKTVFYY